MLSQPFRDDMIPLSNFMRNLSAVPTGGRLRRKTVAVLLEQTTTTHRSVSVAKLVTMWRNEEIQNQARQYVRSYILFPSGLLGLICMLGGLGGLGYQLMAMSTYTWTTFLASSGLLLIGGLCGVAQTLYHRYLLKTVPEVFAARIRAVVRKSGKKARIDPQPTTIEHPGRSLVPLGYAVGAMLLFGASALAWMKGGMEIVPAVLMPWAGFYWGKLFWWRGVVN